MPMTTIQIKILWMNSNLIDSLINFQWKFKIGEYLFSLEKALKCDLILYLGSSPRITPVALTLWNTKNGQNIMLINWKNSLKYNWFAMYLYKNRRYFWKIYAENEYLTAFVVFL